MGRVVRSPVYRRRVTSSRLEPPHTPPAHTVRPVARPDRRRAGRPSGTSPIWTGCSRTASPCCATTTRPPRCWAKSWPSPSASTGVARRARASAGPGCTRSPGGPVCGGSASGGGAARGRTRAVASRAGASEPTRGPMYRRRSPSAVGVNSPRWPGPKPPVRPPSSAKPSNWPHATGSARTTSPPSCPWSRCRPANCSTPPPARSNAPGPRSPSWRRATAPPSPSSPATTRCCSRPRSAASWSGTWTTARAAAAPPSAPRRRAPGPARPPPHAPPGARRPARPPGPRRPPSCRSWRPPGSGVRRHGEHPARPCHHPALRPRRLPHGPEGPRRPPGPAAREGRHHHRRGDRRRRARARPLGRVPGRAADRRGPRRDVGQRRSRRAARNAGGDPNDTYENAGNAKNRPFDPFAPGSHDPDVSVEVVSDGTDTPSGTPGTGTGRLLVTAESTGDRTRITLTATGGEPVSWSAWTSASWLRLSRASGTLAPGRSVTVHVHVDHSREPSGPWRARIGLTPSGSVVAISGYGSRPPPSSHPGDPGRPTHPTRPPSSPPPGTGGPGPSDPTDPTDPTGPPPGTGEPTDPGTGGPSDPPPSSGDPTDPGGSGTPPTTP